MKNLNPSNKEIIVKSHTKDSTLKSKSNVKVYKDNPKPLDSQSLIPQLFNPKFLDSNLNTKAMNPNALDSNFLDSIIESKRYSNLRALIFDRLTFKLKLFSLQESFKFTFFNINILNIL